MKQLKFAIAAAGLAAVVGAFLPIASGLGMSFSLWDMKDAAPATVYATMLGCTLGAVGGIVGIIKAPMVRSLAGISAVGFLLAAIALREKWVDFGDAAYGGKLLMASTAIGLLAASIATARPEED